MKIPIKYLFKSYFIIFISFFLVFEIKDARSYSNNYFQDSKKLLKRGYYFTAVPLIKEYLVTSQTISSSQVDKIVDEIVTVVGVRQFEILPINVLQRSHAPTIRYILAKKFFRLGKYKRSLSYLIDKSIPNQHPVKPFALLLEASIYSILTYYDKSIVVYNDCINFSESAIGRTSDANRIRQLSINRDYCIIGIPRAEFAAKKYKKAHSHYLDLPKSSYIWPEILFEEAWNSFYLKDYNRTLGKLVSYKASILKYIFNAEVEILRAMSYMQLCLWKDAENVVNNFYGKYERDAKLLKDLIIKHGKDYKYYASLANFRMGGQVRGTQLLNRLLKYIIRDAAFIEMFESLKIGTREYSKVMDLPTGRYQRYLVENLKNTLILQRDLIGAYVRKTLLLHLDQLRKSFEDMSFIKLEVLSRKKYELYNYPKFFKGKRKRGDIKYLKRNEKQYFWTFNGEFWADELGDYVFSLKSECRR